MFHISQNSSSHALKLVVLIAPTSPSATALKMFIEFTGFTTAANATGIQIKTAALLRELLKHPAAKQSRVAMALPKTFTKSVKGSPTELSSPSQRTQKRQEKEADFTTPCKQASVGAPLAARFCHHEHTHTHRVYCLPKHISSSPLSSFFREPASPCHQKCTSPHVTMLPTQPLTYAQTHHP